jgi:hypothetical protein
MPKYDFPVRIERYGQTGNAFYILGAVKSGLKQVGVDKAEIAQYDAEAKSGDYDNLLAVTAQWVDLIITDDDEDDWEDD